MALHPVFCQWRCWPGRSPWRTASCSAPSQNAAPLHVEVELRPGQVIRRLWAIALTGLVGGAVSMAIAVQPVRAEPTSANDGTNTRVNRSNNRFDIDGGQLSGDGANLFHSFEQFGLDANQIANFLSDPEIRTIISRVVGGDPSSIDGLIQVSGGDSNLFLLNPSGILFGPNARLDVPGSFTATTATGIGLEGGWFNTSGNNDYASLVGIPNRFAFNTANPGSVVNAGDLQVAEGHSLMLLGGTVVNTGTVEAPGGEILITAVPGESMVRISQDGHVLSLEVQAIAPESSDAAGLVEWSAPVSSLPELLTGGDAPPITALTVNPDGSVALTSTGTEIPDQSGVVAIAGEVNASSSAPDGAGGNVAIAGREIALLDATVDASGTTGGGTILAGGDVQGSGVFPTGDRTYVSPDSVIHANALTLGDGGQVIVWSDQETGFFGTISAQGGTDGGDGGFVEVSGQDALTFRGSVTLTAPNGNAGTLLLDPTDIVIRPGTADGDDADDSEFNFVGLPSGIDGEVQANDPTPTELFESELEGIEGNIELQATRNITIEPLEDGILQLTPGESVTFTADADLNGVGDFTMNPSDIIATGGRDITIRGANITTGDVVTRSVFEEEGFFFEEESGNIDFEATDEVSTGHLITRNNEFPFESDDFPIDPSAGNVTIRAPQGDIQVRSIDASSLYGEGGTVGLDGDTVRIAETIGDSQFNFSSNDASIDVSSGFVESPQEREFLQSPEQPTEPLVFPDTNGDIFIRHAGGVNNMPFVVGDASVNGSQGRLLRGEAEMAPIQSFPVAPNGGIDPNSLEGITIASINTPPTLIGPTQFSTEQNQSVAIAVSSYISGDVNRDNTIVTINTIAPGATLTRNGVAIAPGTAVSVEDALVYTPPTDATGLQDAFTLQANDGVSTSTPVAVQVDVGVVEDQPPPNEPNDPNGPNDPNEPNEPLVPEDNSFNIPEQLDRELNGEEPEDIDVANLPNPNLINRTPALGTYISSLETEFNQDFSTYLGLPEQPEVVTAEEAQDIAKMIEDETGEKPAFIYVSFVPEALNVLVNEQWEPSPTDQLELVVITAEGNMFRQRVPDATREKVMAMANQFRQDITSPFRRGRHEASAQQLYEWMIAPIQDELQAREVTNLSFLADVGLRSLPFAALYDGSQYLMERYSVGLMPSLSLTDTRYVDIRNAEMLAMGVSESTQGQSPLPTVPVELSTLVFEVWRGSLHLNEGATLDNLKDLRQQTPYGIIHMATHADFKAGPIEESYIQLWEERLQMDQVRQLGWSDPPVEMLVLSACRTALGSEEAELGFAGLAVQTGVKSAIASLWYVSDTATTALMTHFYSALNDAPIKADALRQTQIALLRGDIRVEDGRLFVPGFPEEGIELPEGSLTNVDLSHPYYWSGFTVVGNPW